MRDDEESYCCSAKGCYTDDICVGCIFTCADCSADFCREHVTLIDCPPGRFATALCAPCLLAREETAAA